MSRCGENEPIGLSVCCELISVLHASKMRMLKLLWIGLLLLGLASGSEELQPEGVNGQKNSPNFPLLNFQGPKVAATATARDPPEERELFLENLGGFLASVHSRKRQQEVFGRILNELRAVVLLRVEGLYSFLRLLIFIFLGRKAYIRGL